MALVGEVLGDGEDAGVVVPEPEAGRQHRGVDVVELHPQGSAEVTHRDGLVQAAVGHPQVVQQPQGAAREVPELGMVTLGLELGDDDDRQHHGVLGEAQDGARVRQEDGGVEHVGAAHGGLPPALCADAVAWHRPDHRRPTGWARSTCPRAGRGPSCRSSCSMGWPPEGRRTSSVTGGRYARDPTL